MRNTRAVRVVSNQYKGCIFVGLRPALWIPCLSQCLSALAGNDGEQEARVARYLKPTQLSHCTAYQIMLLPR